MYEDYTRQALPAKKYRELLGSAICVFNSNSSFVIENILSVGEDQKYSWYELIDKNSGDLQPLIKDTISKTSGTKIARLFEKIVKKRNRIIHSFQVTVDSDQILATKDKKNKQYFITEAYLFEFIRDNEDLSTLLHTFRTY